MLRARWQVYVCGISIVLLGLAVIALTIASEQTSYPISPWSGKTENIEFESLKKLMLLPAVHPLPAISSSPEGMVSSSHPLASGAGAKMLAMGGNAADAAVAIGFVLSVVEPEMSGIGGRIQILVHTPDGKLYGIDGHTEVPANYKNSDKPVRSGHQITGTPGMVAGLLRLHRNHGHLSLGDVLAPAIQVAKEGAYILPKTLFLWLGQKEDLKQWPGSRETFLKDDDTFYGIDEPFAPTSQGEVILRIAKDGIAGFYTGHTAELIVADQQRHGGPISMEDLAGYKTRDARLLRFSYRDMEIVTMAAPAGGSILARILTLMDEFNLSSVDEATWARVVSQATAYAVNAWELDKTDELLPAVMDKSWAKQMAAKMNDRESSSATRHSLPAVLPDTGVDEELLLAGAHTTHYVAADKSSMAISITQTNGLILGSKVVPQGTGFILAQLGGRGGENYKAGDRPRTAISPTMVLKAGIPLLILGGAGSVRIPSAIAQVVSRVLDRGMTIDDALSAPRAMPMALSRGENAPVDRIDVESNVTQKWSTDIQGILEERGFGINVVDRYGYFAIVQAISIDSGNGGFIGVAEPDWHGAALGPEHWRH